MGNTDDINTQVVVCSAAVALSTPPSQPQPSDEIIRDLAAFLPKDKEDYVKKARSRIRQENTLVNSATKTIDKDSGFSKVATPSKSSRKVKAQVTATPKSLTKPNGGRLNKRRSQSASNLNLILTTVTVTRNNKAITNDFGKVPCS